ncbi:MAG: PDZ domain-containing protein [bacterium]|nr:PDZ domain-containing protein [bacterium]
MMQRIGRSALRLCVPAAALLLVAASAPRRSVFEGLEIVESERGGGVEILSLEDSSPAARASLMPGDRITAIGGRRIAGLDDYVKVSRGLKDAAAPVTVEYHRDGIRRAAELSLRSAVLRERWGLAIIPWSDAKSRGGADYWLDRARAKMREIERAGRGAVTPRDYGEALLSLFTALEDRPDALATAVLIGRAYGDLAAHYEARGERGKAVWCLRRAALVYGNTVRKADGMQDLVLVRDALGDLRKTLAAMER